MIVGFACGLFDLFHPGHVLMLKECKENCDHLIVALNKADNISQEINPNKSAPIFTVDERKLVVESCRYVDEVLVYNSEEELHEILTQKQINIRFLGEDYRDRPITGGDLNIKIHFINRDHGYSSSQIRQKISKNYSN